MKITIDNKRLVNAIQWATKGYDTKSERSYVALHVSEDGSGRLSHSNSTSIMSADLILDSVDIDGQKSVDIALEGKYLQKLGDAISRGDGLVTLARPAKSAQTSINVRTPSGKFSIPTVDATIARARKVVELGEVDDADFFDSLNRIAKITDPAQAGANPFVGTVCLKVDKDLGTVNMLATDRYTVAMMRAGFSFSETDNQRAINFLSESIILPAEAATMISATKGVSGAVTVVLEDTSRPNPRFGYQFPDGRSALFSLSSAVYPEPAVTKMIASSREMLTSSMIVDTTGFRDAIRTIMSLVWTEGSIIFKLRSDTLVAEDATAENRLKIEGTGSPLSGDEEFRVPMDRNVINAALSPITSSKLRLSWNDEASNIALVPVLENGEDDPNVFVAAVMNLSV